MQPWIGRALALLACALTLATCASDDKAATAIAVTVKSDLTIKDELRGVKAWVLPPDAASDTLRPTTPPSFDWLDADIEKPLVIVRKGSDRLVLLVQAVGPNGQTLEYRARAHFEEGQTLRLPVFLSRSCASRTCGAGQVCYGQKVGTTCEDTCGPVPDVSLDQAEITTPGQEVSWNRQLCGDAGVAGPDTNTRDAGADASVATQDAGSDAGSSGGPRDAATDASDGGPRDAGPRDAASDGSLADAGFNLPEGGICAQIGYACLTQDSCCGYGAGTARCVYLNDGFQQICRPTCSTNAQCATGCCRPIADGSYSVCVPGAQCLSCSDSFAREYETCADDIDCCGGISRLSYCVAPVGVANPKRACRSTCKSSAECAAGDCCSQLTGADGGGLGDKVCWPCN